MGLSESAIQQRIQLEAAQRGITLYRNNVGVAIDQNGRHLRYGLANESERLNHIFKSSDLIGITPVLIMPEHVGQIIGVFTAIECKREDWKFRDSDDRAKAQKRFIDHVLQNGGYAGFCNDPSTIAEIVRR